MFLQRRILLVLPIFALAGLGYSADLVSNGSFESPSIPGTNNDGDSRYAYDLVPLTDWSATSGSVAVLTNKPGFFVATDGIQYINLQDNVSRAIWQTLNTQVGATYTLSFDYAGDTTGTLANSDLGVSWGGNSVGVWTPTELSLGDTITWHHASVSVVATSTTTVLKLDGVSSTSYHGPLVDNVQVNAVPEPGTWAVLGLGGLGLLRRRK